MAAEVKIKIIAEADEASSRSAGERAAAAATQGASRAGGATGGPSGTGVPPVIPARVIARQQAQAAQRQRSDFNKFVQGGALAVAPLVNPFSLWGNLLSGIGVNRALATQTGQGVLGRFGLAGAGGTAAATGAIMATLIAIGAAFKALQKTVEGVNAAFIRSAQLYAYRQTTGQSMQFAAQRTALAEAIGVSQQEVLKFGGAINYLNPLLRHASENAARTATTLTATHYRLKVVQEDFKSLMNSLAMIAAPAVNKVAIVFAKFAKAADDFAQKHPRLMERLLMGIGGLLVNPLGAPDKVPLGAVGQTPKMGSAWERMGLVIGGPTANMQMLELARQSKEYLRAIKEHLLKRNQSPGTNRLNPHYNLPAS